MQRRLCGNHKGRRLGIGRGRGIGDGYRRAGGLSVGCAGRISDLRLLRLGRAGGLGVQLRRVINGRIVDKPAAAQNDQDGQRG